MYFTSKIPAGTAAIADAITAMNAAAYVAKNRDRGASILNR